MSTGIDVPKSELLALFEQFLDLHRGGASQKGAKEVNEVGVDKGEGDGGGSSAGSSMGFSWADEVEERESVSSVELLNAPVISDAVKKLTIGGGKECELNDVGHGVSVAVSSRVAVEGGMKRYVKTDMVRRLGALLADNGIKLPKRARFDLALVTYSAATMPAFFEDGKNRLRTLAALGDAALAHVAVFDAFASGMRVESAQYFKSTVLSDTNMRAAFVKSAYRDCVQFASGVEPAVSKAGATALEAIAGVVDAYAGTAAVKRFAASVGMSVGSN